MTHFTAAGSSYDNLLYPANIMQTASEHLVCPDKLKQKYSKSPNKYFRYLSEKKQKYAKIFAQARVDYANILHFYTINNAGLLISKENPTHQPSYPLTPFLLMKVIRKANLLLLNAGYAQTFLLKNISEDRILCCIRNHNILSVFDLQKSKLPDEKNPNFLGASLYCNVQKTYILSMAVFAALKISLNLIGKRDMIDASIKLLDIHSPFYVAGIQPVPLLTGNFVGGTGFSIDKLYTGGSLAHALNSGLLNPFEINPVVLLRSAYILFYALYTIHSRGKIHGDINNDNLLVEFDKINDYKVLDIAFSDFGGTILNSESINITPNRENYFRTAYSQGGYTKTDLLYAQNHSDIADEFLFESWMFFSQKRDVFALAICMWNLFYGASPYLLHPQGYADTDVLIGYQQDRMGEPVKQILMQALHENPVARPEIEKIISVITEEINFLNRSDFLRNLAGRLLVSPEQLREKHCEGEDSFKDYIKDKILKYGLILSQAKDDYAEICRLFYVSKTGTLISTQYPGHRPDYPITPLLLMKAVRKANMKLRKISTSHSRTFKLKKVLPLGEILCKRKDDILSLCIFEKFYPYPYSPNFLAEDGHTVTQKAFFLSQARFATLKIGKTEAALQIIFQEHQELTASSFPKPVGGLIYNKKLGFLIL